MQSETSFWSFITDPDTPYPDRMAAAYQGGSLVSVKQLPRLWTTLLEYEAKAQGVAASPCMFIHSAAPHVEIRGTRPNGIEYPLDLESRGHMPISWQIWQALSVLTVASRMYYSQPEHYQAMAEGTSAYATDPREQRLRFLALDTGPANVDWLKKQIRLAIYDRHVEGLTQRRFETFTFAALLHVAEILVLEKTSNPTVAASIAVNLARRAKISFDHDVPNMTATAVLAIARWAARSEVPEDLRRNTFLAALFELDGYAGGFEEWFEREKPRLEQAAATERPLLNVLAADLGQQIAP